MPNPINGGGVVGTDNVAPLYNPDRRWQVWNMSEIYLGDIAANKYVPKIHDVIMEIIGSTITNYIVMDIDPTTLIPVLHEEKRNVSTSFTDEEILLGVNANSTGDTYRVYIDTSVTPYRLSVDARITVKGTMCRTAKLFRGANVSNDGEVISRVYDTSGNLISENIPLELVGIDNIDNRTIKAISVCNTNVKLADGELVTAVVYDDAGFVVSKRQLLAENTAFIRAVNASKKYIVGINLKSPFLSNTNNRLINFPINVPLNSLNLIGVVTYSNGEVAEYPVDGTKFSIYGFEQYVATIVGQKINVVLKYTLGPDEANYVTQVGSDLHISELYEAITTNVDGSYNIKLYAYPVWIDAINGYTLKWYMYNLDRNIKYEVTPHVKINTTLSYYNPTLYGVLQRLNVSINIKDVNGSYKNFIHVQTIDIVLNKMGSERENNWAVGFTPSQQPMYGVNVFATANFITANSWKVKINSSYTSMAQWLENVYYKTLPLTNTYLETVAPEPNYFALTINGTRNEYPIASWDDDIMLNGNIINNSTAIIQFFKRTGVNDLQLSVAGLSVYHVNSTGGYV